MTRRHGVFKREPMFPCEFLSRFHAIPKANWAELYRDLYQQTHEADGPEEDWIRDAENRNQLLEPLRGR